MNATRFMTVEEFLERAESFLLEHEAHNNLLLGLSSSLKLNPNFYGTQPYFVVVEEAGQVIAAALMTPPFQPILAQADSRPALTLIARDLQQFRPDLPGVLGPAALALEFVKIWTDLTGQTFRKNVAERIYKLEKVKPPAPVSGRLRRIRESDRDLLLKWTPDYQLETFGQVNLEVIARSIDSSFGLPPELRGTFLWEDPQPVSLVGYSGPTPHGMRVGPVYTPVPYRGRGYASAATAAVSQYLLDTGRKFVFLFTDLANPTSNKIYQQIGYEPVCDVDEYKFG